MVRSSRIQDIILKIDITGFGDRLNARQEQKSGKETSKVFGLRNRVNSGAT